MKFINILNCIKRDSRDINKLFIHTFNLLNERKKIVKSITNHTITVCVWVLYIQRERSEEMIASDGHLPNAFRQIELIVNFKCEIIKLTANWRFQKENRKGWTKLINRISIVVSSGLWLDIINHIRYVPNTFRG